MKRFSLLALTLALLAGASTIACAQNTPPPSQRQQQPMSEAAREAWRARWLKRHKAEQARLAAKKQQAPPQASADVPPPVEDMLSTAPTSALPAAGSPAENSAAAPQETEATPTPAAVTRKPVQAARRVAPKAPKRAQITRTDLTAARSKTGVTKTTPAASTAPVPTAAEKPASEPAAEAPREQPSEPNALLSQTKPDDVKLPETAGTASQTQDNPFAAIGDGGRMMIYLLPLLLLLIGGLNLMRRSYARTGKLPGAFQAAANRGSNPLQPSRPARTGGVLSGLLGGFNLHQARQHGGSNIRIVESIPLGNANLHLLEVRGRVLLLGATGGSVSMLAEWDEKPGAGSDEFRTLLQAAAADMDSLDLATTDLPARAIVGTLEEEMRDTGTALTRRARRLRTVLELEAEEGSGAMRNGG